MLLPEREKIASFDVDAQRTFTPLCPDELPVPGGDEIADALNHQAELAGWRIGSKDAHSPNAAWVTDQAEKIGQPGVDAKHAEEHWPVHAVPGTVGFKLLPGLPHPAEYDFFVWKGVEPDMHPYGACFHDLDEQRSTGVIEWLHSKGITHVLVGGLATDYCVKQTALQLANASFEVILNLSACRGIAPKTTETALATMREASVHIIENLDLLTT